MLRFLTACLAIVVPISLLAQAPPASQPSKSFEVATIKPTDPNFGGILVGFPGGTLSLRGFTLKDIIGLAYEVDNRQIFNVPKALESARYDVVGKAAAPVTMANANEWRPMVQALLTERFHLQMHKETREVPVYVMRVVKSGHKMKPRKDGDGGAPMSLLFQGANLPARNVSVGLLASGLQKVVIDRPVIDKTGLTGNFDFDLSWRPDAGQFNGRGGQLPAASDPDRADIFTALQEQLGLKLDSERGPGEVVIVDKVEAPSEN